MSQSRADFILGTLYRLCQDQSFLPNRHTDDVKWRRANASALTHHEVQW